MAFHSFFHVFSGMCRHTGLLVCFACLFLSANPSSALQEKSRTAEASCNAAKLFEIHSQNGSLSLDGLDQILKSVRSLCSSYWKEKEHLSSLNELAATEESNSESEKPSVEPGETFAGNGINYS